MYRLLGFMVVGQIAAASATGFGGQDCGTRLRPEDVPLVRQRMADCVYERPDQRAERYDVSIAFHVVRRSDGTGGLDIARLVRALDDANAAFAGAGLRFCWPSPADYIDDDGFYYDIDTQAEIDALRSTNVVPHSVNVYFTEHLGSEDGALCGISSFTFDDVQGLVMANDCTAIDGDHSSFAHELGHYFDLFHTHETVFGSECPDCSQHECACDVAGDLLCDTPADPGLGTHNVDEHCRYFGTERDPCANSTYAPDPTNRMSFSRKTCRVTFSEQQNAGMSATLTNLRPDHLAADCPADNRWYLSEKLTATDGTVLAGFGVAAALDGDTALIGAYRDEAEGRDAGAAYVFRNVGGVWVERAKLTASDGAGGDLFGIAVALEGDTALIGAIGHYEHGKMCGSAYIFHEIDGGWQQVAKLVASDGAAETGSATAWPSTPAPR